MKSISREAILVANVGPRFGEPPPPATAGLSRTSRLENAIASGRSDVSAPGTGAPRMMAALFSALVLAMATPPFASAAQNDNNVEWNGVYSDATFRQPMSPARGQAFTVELRVFRGDITGARVRTWDGAERKFDLSWVRNEGPYDVWRGNVSGTMANALYYWTRLIRRTPRRISTPTVSATWTSIARERTFAPRAPCSASPR